MGLSRYPCKKGDHYHHVHDNNILEDEDGHRCLSVRAFHVGSLLKELQDDGRAASKTAFSSLEAMFNGDKTAQENQSLTAMAEILIGNCPCSQREPNPYNFRRTILYLYKHQAIQIKINKLR